MAINFNNLPNNNPGKLPEKGTYFGTIKKAEMKTPKTAGKADYLNLQISLQTAEGKSAGMVFDLITESDSEIARFKIRRFVEALQIPITGDFELKDLVKIAQNKQLILDITQENKEGQIPKAIVDVFSGQIYYPMSDASTIFGTTTSPIINAPDADDADLPFTMGDSTTY